MKIKYLGHSSFKLTESTGTSIVTDPYGDVGFSMPPVSADVVTLSHNHYDHNNVGAVSNVKLIIDKEGNFEYGGVKISSFKTYHDDVNGTRRGANLVFKFRMDGLDVCHLGDIGEPFSSDLLESLLPVNILMIPVGAKYTIDGEEAKKYVDAIMPEIVIPMHYRTRESKLTDIEKAQPFIDLFDEEVVEIPDLEEMEFSREDIDSENTKIIMFKRARK